MFTFSNCFQVLTMFNIVVIQLYLFCIRKWKGGAFIRHNLRKSTQLNHSMSYLTKQGGKVVILYNSNG